MKDIRKYIEKNRDIFDDQEPPAGHMERFEVLLNRQEQLISGGKTMKRTLFARALAVAASIAILTGISVKLYTPQSVSMTSNMEESNVLELADEFETTNDYYNQQMEEYIAEIMCKLPNTDKENQSQLTEDLEGIIESNVSFVNEMKNNDNKEIALQYLVKHYERNIQVLENINNKLEKYTQC